MKRVLLVTATVAPASKTFLLSVVDSETRLSQYIEAFCFYLNLLRNGFVEKIIFAENSGYPLERFHELVREDEKDKVVFLSYCQMIDGAVSRFFLEINLIDVVVKNELISCDDFVWKVTGRYVVKNIEKIIAFGGDLRFNLRDVPYKVVDFYVFGFSLAGYKALFDRSLNLYKSTVDGELILRSELERDSISALIASSRFSRIPMVFGYRGFDGRSYMDFIGRLKYLIRCLVDFVLPSIRV